MVKILKNGKAFRFVARKFVCEKCGCLFESDEYDLKEVHRGIIAKSMKENDDFQYAVKTLVCMDHCPCCNEKTWGVINIGDKVAERKEIVPNGEIDQ